jgi:hypothetical protein
MKFGTKQEKRLMINILAFRQSYKRKKIAKIRWIHNHDNFSNALIKATANNSLKQLISTNKLIIKIKEHIKRSFVGNENAI